MILWEKISFRQNPYPRSSELIETSGSACWDCSLEVSLSSSTLKQFGQSLLLLLILLLFD